MEIMMLKIRFLGKPKIDLDNSNNFEQLGSKTYALICLLTLSQFKPMSRDKIIGYLWPDSNDDAAKYNLRYNLWLVKKSIDVDKHGESFLLVNKECCSINKSFDFSCDILSFAKAFFLSL